MIDSFKALRSFAADEAEFRRFLHDLAGRLTAVAASSFWIGEYDRNQAADAPEFAVADAIIALHVNRTAERELRVLQVLKLRGSGFRTGEHAYRIGPDGLDVFPRLADEIDTGELRARLRARLYRDPCARRDDRRRILARRGDAHRRPDRRRQDPDGIALPLPRRRER